MIYGKQGKGSKTSDSGENVLGRDRNEADSGGIRSER
jgi:hypothetical protein